MPLTKEEREEIGKILADELATIRAEVVKPALEAIDVRSVGVPIGMPQFRAGAVAAHKCCNGECD